MLAKAYSPEQAAFGQLENGRDVVILYVKELAEEVKAVRQSQLTVFKYDWFENEQKDSYVLQVRWDTGTQIAIRFNAQHFSLLAKLMEPKDVILVTTPISQLMQRAGENGQDFLEFEGVLTFSQIIFSLPNNPN